MTTNNTQIQDFPSITEALIVSTKSTMSQFSALELESKTILENPHLKKKSFALLIQDIGNHLNTITLQIEQSLGHSSIIHQIKTSQTITIQLRKLIEKCSLIEMKNFNSRNVSSQLKTELKRLQYLQKSWFNTACLKN